jgi:hypothetical protein
MFYLMCILKNIFTLIKEMFKRRRPSSVSTAAFPADDDHSKKTKKLIDRFIRPPESSKESTKTNLTPEERKKKMEKIRKIQKNFFGSPPTPYQTELNSLPGALGPLNPADWPGSYEFVGKPSDLGSQPLVYSGGKYVTAYDQQGYANFDSYGPKPTVPNSTTSPVIKGFGRRRSRRRSRRRRSRRGSRRRRSRRRGSRRRGSRRRSRRGRRGSRRRRSS